MPTLFPEVVAEMFYNGELELELHRIGLEDYRFKLDSDGELFRASRRSQTGFTLSSSSVFPRMQAKRLVKI